MIGRKYETAQLKSDLLVKRKNKHGNEWTNNMKFFI